MSEAHKETLKISTLDQDPFDRQKYIPGWDQSTLEMGKVLIVGAGALGNEVSKNLAQCGVGDIAIIDSKLSTVRYLVPFAVDTVMVMDNQLTRP